MEAASAVDSRHHIGGVADPSLTKGVPRPMRSAHLALLALTSLLAVGACTSAPAGWTYEPAPSVTPAPSTDQSATPSTAPSASGEPSASGSAGASAAPSGSGSPSGAVVSIVASGIAFTTTAVTAPAGTPFTLEFDNQDAATPHNVQIKDASGAKVFETETFPGVEKRSYPVPALAAGSYPFVCTIHANMTGTLTAQ
jgi:plastocyanin